MKPTTLKWLVFYLSSTPTQTNQHQTIEIENCTPADAGLVRAEAARRFGLDERDVFVMLAGADDTLFTLDKTIKTLEM
jgi:hypothetical protein